MPETFFISDTHFGHKAIIEYEEIRRSYHFQTPEDMDEHLVQAWNKVVSPNDKVFHLGDVAFGKRNVETVGRLNGRKHLVMGNHDMYSIEEYAKYFQKISGAVQFESCILTHIPVHNSELKRRFWANVHGHLHSRKVQDTEGRYVCVSVEQLPNLAPIPYDEILNRAVEVLPYG